MQKKTKTYLLLALVLGIWGTVAYKIITGLDTDVPEVATEHFQVQFTPKNEVRIDTFSISPVERDPFLGRLATKKRTPQPSNHNSQPKQEKPWPFIIYTGVIQKDNKAPLYILTIEQQQYILKKGQSAADVQLLKATTTEITVSYKGTRKTIPRS